MAERHHGNARLGSCRRWRRKFVSLRSSPSMNGGALPAALLCAALGLALATAERKAGTIGLAVVAAMSSVIAFAPIPASWSDMVFLGCWASVILNAASVHKPHGLGRVAALALSLNAGFWAGAVTALSPSKMNLLKALPLSLCLF